MKAIDSIHHISATVGNPQENLTFYRDVLGLRLVKKTVNFEDENTYHLYFANQSIEKGSVITFFPREDNLQGRVGAGQVRTIAFSVPDNSLTKWKNHLEENEIIYQETRLFKEKTLEFNDPHGLSLALVETEINNKGHEILSFYGVELLSENPSETSKLLMHRLGLSLTSIDTDYYYLEMIGEQKHRVIVNRIFIERGRLGIGTVHHIAWSVTNEEELLGWKNILDTDYNVTELKNRKYFQSVYFKDPGSIIYELATEGPGFLEDETLEELGMNLMLPPHYENQREEIEAQLPKLN